MPTDSEQKGARGQKGILTAPVPRRRRGATPHPLGLGPAHRNPGPEAGRGAGRKWGDALSLDWTGESFAPPLSFFCGQKVKGQVRD